MEVEPWEILGDVIASKLGFGRRINLAMGKRIIGGRGGRLGSCPSPTRDAEGVRAGLDLGGQLRLPGCQVEGDACSQGHHLQGPESACLNLPYSSHLSPGPGWGDGEGR